MNYYKRIPLLLVLFFASCSGVKVSSSATTTTLPLVTAIPSDTETASSISISKVPELDHFAIIMFENWTSEDSNPTPLMPVFNQYAKDYTFLSRYYGVMHPSLPNYLALIGGETFGVTENCRDCFFDAETLPDLIEASGRTWKSYQEDMPEPCYIGDTESYAQKHNPFVYFDPIRLNKSRCDQNVVPLTALQEDIDAGHLPNFIFITPNICNDGHDCPLSTADKWLESELATLIPALGKDDENYLLVLMFEEGDDNSGCCGLPENNAGGLVPVVMVSPLVKNNFEDNTSYTHYSLLKTISDSWGLSYLGHAADPEIQSIVLPWK